MPRISNEIAPLPPKRVDLIVKNVLAACKDISKLNRTGYGYIYLASGFIAHYNLGGFIGRYSDDGNRLASDILALESQNRWLNFRPGDQNFAYYQQKALIYARIVAGLKA